MHAAARWETPVDSTDLMLVGLLLLAALSVGAIVYLLVNPYFSGERRTDKRMQGVTENKAARIGVARRRPTSRRTASARSPTR